MGDDITTLKIDGLYKDIQDIKEILKEMSRSMTTVATQSIQIQAIQKAQQEHREDIDGIKNTILELSNWKASCPRVATNDRLATMQSWIIGMAGTVVLFIIVFIGAFVAHIFNGK